jgi:hypothetical protein
VKKSMIIFPFAWLVAFTWPGSAWAEAPPTTEAERLGYAIGYQVGNDFRRGALPLDIDPLLEGLRCALEGATPRLSTEEMRAALEWLQQQNTAAQKSDADPERVAPER